jgi:hypothetical protein
VSQFFKEAPPLSPEDQQLVAAYDFLGRTLDDLPYTEDFGLLMQRIRAAGDQRNEREVLTRLQNLRKATRLPRHGAALSRPPEVTPGEEELMRVFARRRLGSVGQRDQLPYTPAFDEIARQFNKETSRNLDNHAIWRLIAKVSK